MGERERRRNIIGFVVILFIIFLLVFLSVFISRKIGLEEITGDVLKGKVLTDTNCSKNEKMIGFRDGEILCTIDIGGAGIGGSGGSYVLMESDPYWIGNVSLFNSSWLDTFNSTTNDSLNNYIIYVNGTATSYVNAISLSYNDSNNNYMLALNTSNNNYILYTNGTMKDYVDANDIAINNSNNNYAIVLNTSNNNYIVFTNGTMKNYVDSQDLLFNDSNNNYIVFNNISMKNYVDSQDLLFNASNNNYIVSYVGTQNTSMKNYVDFQNTSQTNYILVQNNSVLNWIGSTYNVTRNNEVARQNTSMRNYIDNVFNTTRNNYVSVVNTSMKNYVDSNYLLNSGDTATGDYNFDANTLFIDSTDNRIGINTTNPLYSLDIDGLQRISHVTNPYLILSKTGTTPRDWYFQATGDYLSISLIGLSSGLNIDFNNNIGLNTITPQQKLHVVGNILANGTINATTDLCIHGGTCLSGVVAGGSARWDANYSTFLSNNISLTNYIGSNNASVVNWISNTFNTTRNNEVTRQNTSQNNYINNVFNVTRNNYVAVVNTSMKNYVLSTINNGTYMLTTGDTATGNYTFDTTTLHIDSTNDRIGIGTKTPQNKFTVLQSSTGTGYSNTSGTGGSRVAWSTGYGVSLDAWDGGAPHWGIVSFNANTPTVMMEGKYNSNDVIFNAGNVGIGTTSPSSKLEVNGTIYGHFNSTSPNGYVGGSNYGLGAEANSGEYGVISGSVGSGTAGWFYSFGGVAGNFTSLTNGVAGYFDSASGYGLLVNKGNVGIGTTTPVNKLNVLGDGNFTGTVYALGVNLSANNISVTNYIATKQDALTWGSSGDWWGVNTRIGSDGVMEVGKYFDFHESDTGVTDYDARITSASGVLTTSGGLSVTGTFDPNGAITLPTTGISGAGAGSGLYADMILSGTITDLNDSWTDEGTSISNGMQIYRYSSTATNKPVTLDNANWVMNLYSHPTGGVASYGHQISAGNTQDLYFRRVSNGAFSGWSKLYHTDNDGVGSGLDADLLDGLNSSSFLTWNANYSTFLSNNISMKNYIDNTFNTTRNNYVASVNTSMKNYVNATYRELTNNTFNQNVIMNKNLNATGDINLENDAVITRSGTGVQIGITSGGTVVEKLG